MKRRDYQTFFMRTMFFVIVFSPALYLSLNIGRAKFEASAQV